MATSRLGLGGFPCRPPLQLAPPPPRAREARWRHISCCLQGKENNPSKGKRLPKAAAGTCGGLECARLVGSPFRAPLTPPHTHGVFLFLQVCLFFNMANCNVHCHPPFPRFNWCVCGAGYRLEALRLGALSVLVLQDLPGDSFPSVVQTYAIQAEGEGFFFLPPPSGCWRQTLMCL